MSGKRSGPPNIRPLTARDGGSRDAACAPDAAWVDSKPAELVADLIEATALVPPDRLALVRGPNASGRATFADALVAEGLASSDGVARMLAARHRLPLVDLRLTGVAAEASLLMPLHVLRRAVALPYRLEGETLHVALADPQNVQAIDELRLATRYQLSLGVAARDDIVVELDRMDRASDAVVEALDRRSEAERRRRIADLEEEDGVSEGPVVRIVNSIMLEAAEDGASDVHFEAQEDGLVVRYRIDGVLHEVQRIPEQLAPGVTTRLKVLAKTGHRRAAQAAGRPDLAPRRGGRAAARHPPRDPADGRGRDRGHASARQVEAGADARGARAVGRDAVDLRPS